MFYKFQINIYNEDISVGINWWSHHLMTIPLVVMKNGIVREEDWPLRKSDWIIPAPLESIPKYHFKIMNGGLPLNYDAIPKDLLEKHFDKPFNTKENKDDLPNDNSGVSEDRESETTQETLDKQIEGT